MPQFVLKIDNVAALRSATKLKIPDPVHAAVEAEIAGADGIAAHLREDRAYLKDRDIYLLKETVKTRLNLQIAPDPDLVDLALEVKPYRVTFMPMVSNGEMISNGIDFAIAGDRLHEFAAQLDEAGIRYGCLINPDADSVKEAARLKCGTVQLAGYEFAQASPDEQKTAAGTLDGAAQTARKLGMNVSCGGGLDYRNIRVLASLGTIDEFIIGHTVLARALMVGIDRAVRDMADTIRGYTRENPFA
jgi:pyridoxine 5-phosphate synthase